MSVIILPPLFNGEVIDDEQTYSVPCFMKETIKPIGGIGITVRWTYKGIKYDDHDEVGMLCMNIEDPAEFEDAVTSLTKHFVIKRDGEYEEDDEYGNCTSLIIFDAQHIIAVALYIEKYTKFKYEIDDNGARQREFEIGIERFDRSNWNFWNQTEETAAPKQSWHKWDFSWIDPSWNVLPFTWRRLVKNIDISYKSLPKPLCYHKCQYEAALLKENMGNDIVMNARYRAMKRFIPFKPHVTPSLTTDQSRELLFATLCRRFLQSGERLKWSKSIFDKYILYGYTSRLFGPYEQGAKFVGYGENPRKFKKLPQYEPESLSIDVLNKIYKTDGSFGGKKIRVSRKRTLHSDPREMNNDINYAKRLCVVPDFFLANT